MRPVQLHDGQEVPVPRPRQDAPQHTRHSVQRVRQDVRDEKDAAPARHQGAPPEAGGVLVLPVRGVDSEQAQRAPPPAPLVVPGDEHRSRRAVPASAAASDGTSTGPTAVVVMCQRPGFRLGVPDLDAAGERAAVHPPDRRFLHGWNTYVAGCQHVLLPNDRSRSRGTLNCRSSLFCL